MPKFIDLEGQSWNLAITIGDARRIKDEVGIDILDADALPGIVDDLFKQFDLLAGLCQSQIKELGITVEDFDRRLADLEVHEAACQALREALVVFFHRARRPELVGAMAKAIEAAERMRRLAQRRMESPKVQQAIEQVLADAESEMDAALDRELAKISFVPSGLTPGTKSSEWPAPAESTPSP